MKDFVYQYLKYLYLVFIALDFWLASQAPTIWIRWMDITAGVIWIAVFGLLWIRDKKADNLKRKELQAKVQEFITEDRVWRHVHLLAASGDVPEEHFTTKLKKVTKLIAKRLTEEFIIEGSRESAKLIKDEIAKALPKLLEIVVKQYFRI